jgi:citrate synthase
MGECKIDHSKEDVQKKYESQREFLPQEIQASFSNFLGEEHTQDILNEVFHLLKKYDLANEKEKEERNNRLNLVLNNV